MPLSEQQHLRIVHCFRSPVGGIFRHVRDLLESQVSEGHKIGILCDSITGGDHEEALFDAIAPQLELGLFRIPMDRKIGPSDLVATWRAYQNIKNLKPEVIHSHGAKGGAYARIIGTILRLSGVKVARIYCPHGGSIHYDASTLSGRVYFFLERLLERATDRLIFVSDYEKQGYFNKVGQPKCAHSLVHNGLNESEFVPVENDPDVADFLYIGMMRDLKGADLLIDALPAIEKQLGRTITARLVGDGPDLGRYKEQVASLGLNDRVTFFPPMAARKAFAMAKVVVVPSRAESLPYIVLETIAAAKPLVTTNVGGIPEIYRSNADVLVTPGEVDALASAMARRLQDPEAKLEAKRLAREIKGRFTVKVMAEAIGDAYRDTLGEIRR